jgi:hypothetical protein
MPTADHNDESVEVEIRRLAAEKLPLLDKLKEWRTARADGAEDSRAFVIEFAGLPKAGKSGTIANVRHYFTYGSKVRIKVIERPYRIYTPAEGVSRRTPAYLKDNLLDYNCWAGAYALQKLLEANHDNYHDLVILDRGPWDTGCWVEYLRTSKLSLFRNDDDANKISAFFQLSHWKTQSDLHVVFTVDPVEAAMREKRGRLIEHNGPASDEQLMSAMRKIYASRFADLQKAKAAECPHVGKKAAVLIDTTTKKPLEVAWQVIESAFAVLGSKIAYRAVFTAAEMEDRLIRSQSVPPRPPEVLSLKAFIPRFLERANELDPSRRGRLRDKLVSVVPSSDDEDLDLFAAQLHAAPIIADIEKTLGSLEDERED